MATQNREHLMKIIKLILLSLAVWLAAATGVRAQDYRTDINPALLYYKSFLLAPDWSPAERDYLFNTNWQGKKLPEHFGQLMSNYDRQFGAIRQAAHATEPCDWGIDWSAGPGTLLPQLARCKQAAITAQLRVPWELQNGNEADACGDLVATVTLARNSSRDGSIIAALVQIAIENIVCSTVAENYYQISPEGMKQIADGFDAAPARGTLAAAFANEKSLSREWLVNKILALQQEHPGDDAKVMAALGELFQGETTDDGKTDLWTEISRKVGGTSDGLLKTVRDEFPLYDKLAAVSALPEPQYEVQIKQFAAEVQSAANPLFSMAFSPVTQTRPREFRAQANLAMVRAATEYKLHGEDGLKSVMDPFGNGPFRYERFVFKGVDRGFKLTSAYAGGSFPAALIFVEKEGPPFLCYGVHIGQPSPAQ
jgi:hypothetical protein